MEKEMRNIEELFQSFSNNYEQNPSSHVLKKIRAKLFWRDFFGFQLSKFNIFYTLAIVGTLSYSAFALFVDGKNESTDLQRIVVEKEQHLNKQFSQQENPIKETVEISRTEKSSMKPNALFDAETLLGCAPLEIKFTDRSTGSVNYSWNFGDGSVSNAKNPTHIFEKPGEYTVKLTIEGENDLFDVRKELIKVLDKPEAGFTLDVDQSDIGSRSIKFNNGSQGSDSYVWKFGDYSSSNESSPMHTYGEYKPYEVSLIARNKFGCSDTVVMVNTFLEKNYLLSFPLNFRPSPLGIESDGYYEIAGSESIIFHPKNEGVDKYELNIYAPNGQLVFHTRDIKRGWNGFLQGRVAPGGIYTYASRGVYPNGKSFDFQGEFELVASEFHDIYNE